MMYKALLRTALYATLAAATISAAPPPRRPLPSAGRAVPRQEQRYVPGAYIVELTGDAAAITAKAAASRIGPLADRAALMEQHRARVAKEQAKLRPALVAKGARINHSVDIVMNAFMVKYDGNVQDLESIPGVKLVYPVRRLYRNLDRAVALAQVTDVWNSIGGFANAGKGIKIGIIDTGIDLVHPGFSDAGFQAPAGYPKSDTAADMKLTNNKVIVARSYADMVSKSNSGTADPDPTAQDHVGHGTANAMISAGGSAKGPYGTIRGVAPGAYLGVYRVFTTPDSNGYDSNSDDADIAAVNDAVADGMDVINFSLGSPFAQRFAHDPLVAAMEAAYLAGTLPVISAGNSGPGYTSISSPATAPHAIAVGASSNDRAFGPAVWGPYVGTWGGWNGSTLGQNTASCNTGFYYCSWVYNSADGPAPTVPATGPLVDASSPAINNSLGCSAFNVSLAKSIVAINRGTCTFAVKVQNAQNAGAIAVLLVDTQADTDGSNGNPNVPYGPSGLPSGLAGLIPAQIIDYYSASYILSQLALTPFSLTMSFNACGDSTQSTPCAFAVTPNLMVGFSSNGPNVDLGIKPEVMAPGENMSMATQRYDSNGDMFDSTGYTVADGTSFSSPFTAGVVALIKAARPGLTSDQYRSLVINSTKASLDPNGNLPGVQQTGAGLVNALNAYSTALVASPQTLGLGASSDGSQLTKTVTLTNLGSAADTYSLSASSNDGILQPVLPSGSVTIAAGQSQDVTIQFKSGGLTAGAYQGFVSASSAANGSVVRIPYWLDVPSAAPVDYYLLSAASDSYRNRALLDAFEFRLLDAAGAPITTVVPSVTVVSGGGSVTAVNSTDNPSVKVPYDATGNYYQDIPGMWTVDIVLGPSSVSNVFRVTAGSVTFNITIQGCRTYDAYGTCQP